MSHQHQEPQAATSSTRCRCVALTIRGTVKTVSTLLLTDTGISLNPSRHVDFLVVACPVVLSLVPVIRFVLGATPLNDFTSAHDAFVDWCFGGWL